MIKKIAIPTEDGILCPHFGHCRQLAIIDTENCDITKETYFTPPPHEPGLLPAWLAEKGVTDVIAGGMGQKAIMIFNDQNINVFIGAPLRNAKDLVSDFLKDKLVLTANYCDHKGNHDHENCKH